MTDEAVRNSAPEALMDAARSSLASAHVHLTMAMHQLARADAHRERALQASGSFEDSLVRRAGVLMGDTLSLIGLITPQCWCGQRHLPACPPRPERIFGGATLISPAGDES